MINPTSNIAKRWYRVSNDVVVEIYNSKPAGDLLVHCVGYDNMPDLQPPESVDVICELGNNKNPYYGEPLPDVTLASMFPHIMIEYVRARVVPDGTGTKTIYATQKEETDGGESKSVYIDNLTGEETFDENTNGGDISNQPAYTFTTENEAINNAAAFTMYLWLDRMIEDGHQCFLRSENGIKNAYCYFGAEENNGACGNRVLCAKADTEHQMYFLYYDVDNPGADPMPTYADVWFGSLVDDIVEGLNNGRTIDDVIGNLPWYVQGEGLDANGDRLVVTGCGVPQPISGPAPVKIISNGVNQLFDINTGTLKPALLEPLLDRLNKKAYDCVSKIYDDVVVSGGLDGQINVQSDSEVKPFS